MKTIIITGTDGFIGSNLKTVLTPHFRIIEINENIIDLDYREIIQSTFSNNEIECVFHVGACSDTLETNVNYMMLVNYEFTKFLADVCNAWTVPLVYSSSAANYGDNDIHPSNLYGWSKYAGEDAVINRNGIALRYYNVYGPGEEHKGRMSSVALQSFIKHKNGETSKLFPLNPRRDFVYIKDVISANLYAYENYHKLSGSYYEVGSGDARTFEDVLNIMNIPFEYHSEDIIPKGYQFYTCSMKDSWMSGWEPSYNLEKGLTHYLEYLNEH